MKWVMMVLLLLVGCASKKPVQEEVYRHQLSEQQRAALEAIEDDDFPEAGDENTSEDLLENEEDE